MRYGLGLDVGANSLGWSVYEIDEDGAPLRLDKAGVRIFSDGRDEQSMATLAAERREARTARRRRDRYLQRRGDLPEALTRAGLFPADAGRRRELQAENPLQLRAEAAAGKPDNPHKIGRALFHLNQRRGFKSNRKDAEKDEKESGKIKSSVEELRERMRRAKSPTFGAYLHAHHQKGEGVRARPTADGKGYDNYPDRAMLEAEFDAICREQKKHYPSLLGGEVIARLRHVIFYQRPLREPELGLCAFVKGEERAHRALPSLQRYRIYQEVNNLEWAAADGGRRKLRDFPAARDAVITLLEKDGMNDKGKVTFGKIKAAIGKCLPGENAKAIRLNLESDKRKELDGDGTAKAMRDERRLGAQWDEWDIQKRDDFVAVICGGGDDEAACARLAGEFDISADAAKRCINARLQAGTASISAKAAALLTAKMRDECCLQSDAVRMLDEDEAHPDFSVAGVHGGKLLGELPYYGEAFLRPAGTLFRAARRKRTKKDERKYWGGVSNPTVHIALNQIRRVINELAQIYQAMPESVAIELGRELPMGTKRRGETSRAQAKNQNINDELNGKLRRMGKRENHNNRRRLRLWEELGEKEEERFCPYSGALITGEMAFSAETEVDHILPFQDSLDDTYANLALCTKSANRAKGKQTPFEAFGGSPGGYQWEGIFARAEKLPKAKFWRFQPDARQILEGRDGADFLSRHLNDTRYIGVLAKDYLAHICKASKIKVLTGRLTALLRAGWGLNGILQDGESGGGEKPKKKNRDDHRHHAVDAIVAGATTRAIIQQVSAAAEQCEDGQLNIRGLFEYDEDGEPKKPWPDFRQQARAAVGNIIVSHKPRRQKAGKLHNETAYGIVGREEKGGLSRVFHHKAISQYEPTKAGTDKLAEDLKRCRPHLHEGFVLAYKSGGRVGAVEWLRKKGVRRLRQERNIKVIPITTKDKAGREHRKYLAPDGNWCAEIYAYPPKCDRAGEWHAEVITRFEANQKTFRPGITRRPHPAARLVMRLHKDDYILAATDGGEEKLMRLQKMSSRAKGGVTLEFADPREANVDKRHRAKEKLGYWQMSPRQLKKHNARKVHVSPAGRLSR